MKKATLIFVILSVVASAINYATYPLLARILPAAQYIDITVALSLLTQITTFLSSIIAITIGLSKSEEAGSNTSKIELLQSILFKLFLGITVCFFLASPLLMQRIHVPLSFAIPISLMMIISIPIAIVSGYLNGKARLVKLGILTATSAALQCSIAVSVALVTHSGLLAMLSMAAAQTITILVIYRLFASEQLPKLGRTVLSPVHVHGRSYMFRLATYAFFSAIAIMSINIAQIADLLIIQGLENGDAKFYTDIYVISRIVFFAGLIFIWPFLSEINIRNHHLNRLPFAKVTSFFAVIGIGAVGALHFFGGYLTKFLFGATYDLEDISRVGTLSVIYKVLFLLITAIVLYFTVLRSYLAVWLAVAATSAVAVYAAVIAPRTSTETALLVLNGIAGVVTIIGIALLIGYRIRHTH